jgi:hypothetical protein
VALITNLSRTGDRHSSIVEYLETVAIIGGVAFLLHEQGAPFENSSATPLHVRPKMSGTGTQWLSPARQRAHGPCR